MKKTSKFLAIALLFCMVFSAAIVSVSAEETTEDTTEVTAADIGVSEAEANAATEEETAPVEETGTLIEIGNTTAEETTIIIRTEKNGETADQTVQIDADTDTVDDSNAVADLSDWIAGDQVTFTAQMGENSGELKAMRLRNRSFKNSHYGRNGWVKEIRAEEQEMDVEWAGKIYTLNTENARMVAGNVNPAALSDFQIDDRIRARVVNDNDGDPLTWDAKIIVVLRRGETLFMRVTRWVVPVEITAIPEDTAIPYVISAKVLPSKFYEKGDVNNLVGEPGTQITIEVNEKTKLVRRYLGRAVIGEFAEGDNIRVVGRLNEGTGNLDALLVKNNSIQALGISNRVSEVTAVDTDANTITVSPIAKKNPLTGLRKKIGNALSWTLRLNDETIINKAGESITIADVEEGDIVRVRGIANRLSKTVAVNAISVITERFNQFINK